MSGHVEGRGIVLYEDNEGANSLADNSPSPKRGEHIDVRCHFIREFMDTGNIYVVHVVSGWQHADILTKPLSITLCVRHRRVLMNSEGDK